DRENIFAFTQRGRAQDLLARQIAVGLHFNRAQLVIGIFEKQAAASFACAKVKASAKAEREYDSRNSDERAPIPLLRRGARTHLHVEQMLPAPLPPTGDAPIARTGALAICHRVFLSILARESSMMRTQRS